MHDEALRKLSFPNYESLGNTDKAYENFILNVMAVIDSLAPSENKHIKGTLQDA